LEGRSVNAVTLLSMDFGTTTSSAVIAKAKLVHSAVTGRKELSEVVESFRSPVSFTPILQDRIEELQVKQLLDDWIDAGEQLKSGWIIAGFLASTARVWKLVTSFTRRRLSWRNRF
jgi:ethanolamine utilization protein EutA